MVHEVILILILNIKINFTNILVVQTSFVRTLATEQAKGPMDYVKQGVDQLGQAAEKVKEAVSSAASTVAGAVRGDNNASKLIYFSFKKNILTNKIKHLDEKVEDARRHGEFILKLNKTREKKMDVFR
jgi:hypothetical protein